MSFYINLTLVEYANSFAHCISILNFKSVQIQDGGYVMRYYVIIDPHYLTVQIGMPLHFSLSFLRGQLLRAQTVTLVNKWTVTVTWLLPLLWKIKRFVFIKFLFQNLQY